MAVGVSGYPSTLDTTTELIEAANKAISTLSSGIDGVATTIPLVSASLFTTSGVVSIGNEIISYTGKSGNSLTGCVRGFESTFSDNHTSGTLVRQLITARSHNVLASAIIALETKLGTGTKIDLGSLQNVTGPVLLGREATTGAVQVIGLGANLQISFGNLQVTGSNLPSYAWFISR